MRVFSQKNALSEKEKAEDYKRFALYSVAFVNENDVISLL